MLRPILLLLICSWLYSPLTGQDFLPVTTVCQDGPFTLMSPLTDGNTYTYQWERSFDGGTSWSATGTDAISLVINNPAPGIRYRLAYAPDATCLADLACRNTTSGTELSVSIPAFSQGLTTCQGDTLFVGTTPLTTPGNHRTVLTTADGACDSIVNTFLQILPAYNDLFLIDLCPGELFRGLPIAADTVINEAYTAVSGCDSLITYEIAVAFGIRPMISGPSRICAGETASLEVDGNFATYAWSTGNDGDDAPVSAPGIYTLTLTDFTGCTLELQHELAVTDLQIENIIVTPPACPGGTSGSLDLEVTGDSDLLYSVDGGSSFQLSANFSDLAAGEYAIVVENADGCNTDAATTITDAPALNLTMNLPETTTIERGDSLPLSLETDFEVAQWNWVGRAFLSCSDCPSPVAYPTVDTKFEVEAVAPGGCSVTDSIMVIVNDNRRYYAPTAFSPNGDNRNDRWQVYAGPRTEMISGLQIADRWGGVRFQQAEADLPPDQVSWDGTQAGQPLPVGDYVYSATLRYTDGSSQVIRGQITLMR